MGILILSFAVYVLIVVWFLDSCDSVKLGLNQIFFENLLSGPYGSLNSHSSVYTFWNLGKSIKNYTIAYIHNAKLFNFLLVAQLYCNSFTDLFLPGTDHTLYTVAAPGSSCERPNSNPGPLPKDSGGLQRSHHIYCRAESAVFPNCAMSHVLTEWEWRATACLFHSSNSSYSAAADTAVCSSSNNSNNSMKGGYSPLANGARKEGCEYGNHAGKSSLGFETVPCPWLPH